MSAGTSPPKLQLYRAVACPYSHRVEMVLAAKGLAAQLREIDLLDRPAWFMTMASGGRIPLLDIDGFLVPFADRVNEFLDERFPSPESLLGTTPEERSVARTMVDWCTTVLGPTYEPALMNVEPEREASLFAKLDPVLDELERRVSLHGPAPYWQGTTPGIVDFTFASILLRFAGLEEFHGWSMPPQCVALSAWRETLIADRTVRSATDLPAIMAMLAEYRRIFVEARQS